MAARDTPRLRWSVAEDSLILEAIPRVRLPLSDNPPSVTSAFPRDPAWEALENLWEEELARTEAPGLWTVSFQHLFKLSLRDLTALRIPYEPRIQASVRVKGVPGHPGLGITVETESPEHGRLESAVERRGPFYIPLDGEPFLIQEPLHELLTLRNAPPEGRNVEDHFEFLARAKRAAQSCGARMDRYLQEEEYYFPESVALDIEIDSPEEITLNPRLGGDTPPVEAERLLRPRVPKVETRKDGHRSQRIVLSPEIREQVEGVRERHKIRGADVPRFAENPEAYLPPGIDLSDFSERVKGIRSITYNSRPYLHIRQSSGGWFEGVPGVHLERTDDDDPGAAGEAESEPAGLPEDLSPERYRELVKKARAEGTDYVRFGDGWVHVDPDRGDDYLDAIDKLGADDHGSIRFPKSAILDIYENLEKLEFELPPISTLEGEELGLHIDPDELPDPPLPSQFNGALRPYQSIGYRWLANLDQRHTGGLLADDMGLGKTVQVIAHLTRLAEDDELTPTLIVCPKTLIPNWQREIRTFFPELRSLTELAGSRFHAEDLVGRDIVIASYDTVRRSQLEIAKVDWKLIVSDEAQYAKNPTAQRTTALKALKARHRVALTGTPVENGLIEFWCIMDFVRPGLLGSWKEFRTDFERPLVEAESEEARQELVGELLGRIGPHYLRRLKEDTLSELPAKHEHRHEVGLSEEQLAGYRALARSAVEGGRGAALGALTRLLILCGHPSGLSEAHDFVHQHGICPKLDATLGLLREIQEQDEKALVFTRFKRLQRILQHSVRSELGIWPDVINGEITGNRQQIIDRFSATPGFNVLILSQEVGGVGLNIVAANHVIHYTRPWNPAKENQATDRVYRIRQERPVHVHLPIVTHDRFVTVEEKLDDLLQEKAQLAKDVLRPSKEAVVQPDELWACVEEASQDTS